MRYLILVRSTTAFEAEDAAPVSFRPDPAVFAEMAAFHEELARAGASYPLDATRCPQPTHSRSVS